MSYVRIWVHLVFATKNRDALISKQNSKNIYLHIIENCKIKDIFLETINGHKDHIHCLVSLGKEQSIAQVSQLVKGESSFWINKNKITPFKFAWQDDYFAVSVSESQMLKVKAYIQNQEEHHRHKSFQEEVNEFINKYGFVRIKD